MLKKLFSLTSKTIVLYVFYKMFLKKLLRVLYHQFHPSCPLLKYKTGGIAANLLLKCNSLQQPYQPKFQWSFGLLSTLIYPYVVKYRQAKASFHPPKYHRTTYQLPIFNNKPNESNGITTASNATHTDEIDSMLPKVGSSWSSRRKSHAATKKEDDKINLDLEREKEWLQCEIAREENRTRQLKAKRAGVTIGDTATSTATAAASSFVTCCPDIVPSGEVSIDWTGATEQEAEAIYIIVPGLTGSSKEYYILSLINYLQRKNQTKTIRIGAYNPRGRGGNKVTSNFLYSAGYTVDLRRVLQQVHDTVANDRPIILIGFSLGANVVSKLLGELGQEGKNNLINGAVVCSPPIDLLSMSNYLTNGGIIASILDKALVHNCNKQLSNDPNFKESIQNNRPTSMAELDGQIIAPMMGCQNASHYYRVASSGLWLHQINVPTLFVLPQDDPIIDGTRVRHDDFCTNPYLMGVMLQSGGHSMDLPFGSTDETWFGKVVVDFSNAVRSIT